MTKETSCESCLSPEVLKIWIRNEISSRFEQEEGREETPADLAMTVANACGSGAPFALSALSERKGDFYEFADYLIEKYSEGQDVLALIKNYRRIS